MKKYSLALLTGALCATASCQDFLDVNTNPNAPQTVTANLYLPPMLHWLGMSTQWDGRFIGRYTQQWINPATTTLTTWDRMGYDRPPSDNGGQTWRDVYWTFGQNLVDMMDKSRAEQRWDLLGVGYVLKAWGWQTLTDIHGEIIVKEAIDQSKFSFNYDSQEYAYAEVRKLIDSAIVYLQKTDGAVDQAYLARGDKIYNGDRTKWLKFAYGLLAMNLNHYSNHASYDPDAVIAAVNNSFTSNADDALASYPATSTDNADRNFLGPTRGNHNSYRQSDFVVGLMNGTVFGAVDPRMTRMLSEAPNGTYRGLDIDNTYPTSAQTATDYPKNLFGYTGTTAAGLPGKYLFADKAKMPIMTYAQLQFIKAEAAYRDGDRATALAAYQNGISAHIDFVNARNSDDGQWPSQITATEKAAFLADPRVVPTAANLTLTHIMSQKYIAQWAWAHVELWMDMRRYHYIDIDPASGQQVFPGFQIPTNLDADNGGKPVQRIRPRYNSEYVWNRAGLDVIGGLATDYHTKELCITDPNCTMSAQP